MTAKEAGEKFLNDLLAHVPADKQAAARDALAASEAALTELGAGYLRQSDYSRNMDEVRQKSEQAEAWHATLTEWYEANKAKLEAPDNPNPSPTPNPSPIQSPANAFTREDFQRELAAREQAALQAIVATNQLSARHLHTFNEVLDITKLMADPEITKIGLLGVYDKHYKPKYDELKQKAENDRIEAEVQKRLAESRRAMPYPTSPRIDPSPLDAIEAALKNPADPNKPVAVPIAGEQVLQDAVAQYEAALAQRGA